MQNHVYTYRRIRLAVLPSYNPQTLSQTPSLKDSLILRKTYLRRSPVFSYGMRVQGTCSPKCNHYLALAQHAPPSGHGVRRNSIPRILRLTPRVRPTQNEHPACSKKTRSSREESHVKTIGKRIYLVFLVSCCYYKVTVRRGFLRKTIVHTLRHVKPKPEPNGTPDRKIVLCTLVHPSCTSCDSQQMLQRCTQYALHLVHCRNYPGRPTASRRCQMSMHCLPARVGAYRPKHKLKAMRRSPFGSVRHWRCM
ncbi:hypothetical protein DM02DRAFT_315658 [Periconia macrospinosa]|uniref:Uncharacterized protein n=1 Tax=Periconia macrospinosa TaxID=97972 RepID=A0A2V1D178_9PLEO|nr:hypothetical protein DM02DRAFT_315658 [Periconia macrospinosa]